MLFSYVDESERNDSHYFLGAVIVNAEQGKQIETAFSGILAAFACEFPSLNESTELHGSSIMRGAEEPWRQIPFRAKTSLYRQALAAIAESGARVYLEGIDIGKLARRGYANPLPPRELAFGFILERINETCARTNELSRIIADDHHTAAQSHSQFANYQVSGTLGYKASTLRRIVGPIEFADSRSLACLQAADLVTYLFNRKTTVAEGNPKTQAVKDLLWEIIAPACAWPRGRSRIWPG